MVAVLDADDGHRPAAVVAGPAPDGLLPTESVEQGGVLGSDDHDDVGAVLDERADVADDAAHPVATGDPVAHGLRHEAVVPLTHPHPGR